MQHSYLIETQGTVLNIFDLKSKMLLIVNVFVVLIYPNSLNHLILKQLQWLINSQFNHFKGWTIQILQFQKVITFGKFKIFRLFFSFLPSWRVSFFFSIAKSLRSLRIKGKNYSSKISFRIKKRISSSKIITQI